MMPGRMETTRMPSHATSSASPLVSAMIQGGVCVLDEGNRMGLSLPGLALAKQLYLALQAQGHGRDGTHALQLALASLSNIDWRAR